MSKIDHQALREAAVKATWGDWDSYKPHRGARGYEVRLSSQAIAQHVLKNNAEFIAAFNPKVALALLDERERNQQYIKRRDQENEDIALTVGKLRVEREAAKKRIAELEAELVSQTYKLNELSGNSPVTPDGWVMVPKRLTAENGAKGALSGEFSETTFISCLECFGDDDCDTCDGSGRIEIKVPVTWSTIKSIWDKGIEYFAAKPSQEVK
ncbi:TPA: ead/Ea22-like family protein [Escherichia coli]|nr:ead/Ea22-like family protein [Escherichia coli]